MKLGIVIYDLFPYISIKLHERDQSLIDSLCGWPGCIASLVYTRQAQDVSKNANVVNR